MPSLQQGKRSTPFDGIGAELGAPLHAMRDLAVTLRYRDAPVRGLILHSLDNQVPFYAMSVIDTDGCFRSISNEETPDDLAIVDGNTRLLNPNCLDALCHALLRARIDLHNFFKAMATPDFQAVRVGQPGDPDRIGTFRVRADGRSGAILPGLETLLPGLARFAASMADQECRPLLLSAKGGWSAHERLEEATTHHALGEDADQLARRFTGTVDYLTRRSLWLRRDGNLALLLARHESGDETSLFAVADLKTAAKSPT